MALIISAAKQFSLAEEEEEEEEEVSSAELTGKLSIIARHQSRRWTRPL